MSNVEIRLVTKYMHISCQRRREFPIGISGFNGLSAFFQTLTTCSVNTTHVQATTAKVLPTTASGSSPEAEKDPKTRDGAEVVVFCPAVVEDDVR